MMGVLANGLGTDDTTTLRGTLVFVVVCVLVGRHGTAPPCSVLGLVRFVGPLGLRFTGKKSRDTNPRLTA